MICYLIIVFFTKKALPEFPFQEKLYVSFHLIDLSHFYLQWFQKPISADFAKIADFSKINNVINQYVVTLNKTCHSIIEGMFQVY